jgi:membrane-associated protein
VFDQLTEALTGSAWAYGLILLVVAGDAVLPLLPGETMVVTGGVLSATGDLNVFGVFAAGAIGAFLGDAACYWLGRKLGSRAASKLLRGERGKRSIEWAQRQLDRRGKTLIAVGRFVPGGRTAIGFTAGITHYPWPTFALADAVGVTFWSAYNAGLGRIGGAAFEEQTWKGLLLAFGLALAGAGLIELVRWIVGRRRSAA